MRIGHDDWTRGASAGARFATQRLGLDTGLLTITRIAGLTSDTTRESVAGACVLAIFRAWGEEVPTDLRTTLDEAVAAGSLDLLGRTERRGRLTSRVRTLAGTFDTRMRVAFLPALSDEWRSVRAVRVGAGDQTRGRAQHLLVSDEDRQIARIEVFPQQPDSFAFQDAILWSGQIAIGYGSYVYLISLADFSARTLSLDAYFGHFYPTEHYLLIASGEGLLRVDPDRVVVWRSEVLGIDGVIVSDAGPGVIRGEGEWDPPRGWKAFTLDARTGCRQS